MDNGAFKHGMTKLIGAFPRELEMNPNQIAVWMEFLGALDDAVFLSIVDGWIKGEAKAPAIADLLKRATEIHGDDGEEAWRFVTSTVMSARYRLPGFDSPARIADAVHEVGGWKRIGWTDEDNMHFVKRGFLAAYAKHARAEAGRFQIGAGR